MFKPGNYRSLPKRELPQHGSNFSYHAKRFELAEMTDQGKLAEAQAQFEFAHLMTAISDKERERDGTAR
jgi:hypothetical protein